jgi:hypothetical protein
MSKLLFRYKNKDNKQVDVVMDPFNLSHMEFVRKKQSLYKIYDAENDFDQEVKRLTRLSSAR